MGKEREHEGKKQYKINREQIRNLFLDKVTVVCESRDVPGEKFYATGYLISLTPTRIIITKRNKTGTFATFLNEIIELDFEHNPYIRNAIKRHKKRQ